jgi:uncharacterized integral membrane protein
MTPETKPTEKEGRGMPKTEASVPANWIGQAKFVAVLVLVVLVLIVIFQNVGTYPFQLLFWELKVSVSAVMVGLLLIGVVVGMLAAHLLGRRQRRD